MAEGSVCEDGDPRRERYGTDCSCCHDEFGLSGSVADDSLITSVVIRDASGLSFEVVVNPYGNFFRHVALAEPVEAGVRLEDGSIRMMAGEAGAACNACHSDAGGLGLLGAH